MTHAYGWNKSKENHAEMVKTQLRFDLSDFMDVAVPNEVNNFGKVPVKDQDGQGACTGFSRSTVEELLNLNDTHKYTRLSAAAAYIWNQMCSDCYGADDGASIAGSVAAAAKYGICRDELMPFTEEYNPNIPAAATAEGIQHLIGSHSVLTSSRQIRQYIGTAGLVQLGTPVGVHFETCPGVLTLNMVECDAKNMLGGHALPIIGYLLPETVESFGLDVPKTEGPYLFDIQNSWTDQWGYQGHCFATKSAIDYLCELIGQGEVSMAGYSQLQDFNNPSMRLNWKL